MTVANIVYTAHVLTDPERELDVKGGTITLDAGSAPHVQGNLTISWPDAETLTALDPRESARVRVTVDGEFPAFSTHREFDLGIRTRTADQRAREITLTLASDEALLDDYRAAADDLEPYELSASLADIVAYVLDTAIPGTVPPASGPDADMTPYWSVVNQQRNPAVSSNTNNWSPGGGCTISWVSQGTSGVVRAAMTGASGAVFMVNTAKYDLNATPGDEYNVSVLARCEVPFRAGETAHVVIRFLDNNNATISNLVGTAVQMQSGEYRTLTMSGRAPANAAKIAPYVSINGSQSGRAIILDGAMIYEGDPRLPVDSFTGGNVPGFGYTYEFQGPSNDSPSVRIPDIERDPESLIWKAGQSALEFLHPLLQSAGLRLVCDETRTWTIRDENYTAPGSYTVRYGINLIDGRDSIDRAAGLWYDAAVTIYTWTDRNGIEQTRIDYFELHPNPTKVQEFRKENTPYPGPGFSEYAVRRAQSRGRDVEVTTLARWTESAEQPITATLDGADIQVGKTDSVTFSLGPGDTRDRVTVTTRTTDTPPEAWVLIPESETWLDQPAGDSWPEEVI